MGFRFSPSSRDKTLFSPYLNTKMKKPSYPFTQLFALAVLWGVQASPADEANGLAPEVTDLNAEDVSYALEAKLPDLKKAFINTTPGNRKDGIPVGELGVDGGDKESILKFAEEIAAGEHDDTDSLLLFKDGKLLFESYYRRGRVNYPHYQMSITKSYTAMALGRAIQLGYLTMADLDKPVVSFLKDIDQSNLVDGAADITLAEAMNMGSGIRIDQAKAKELMKSPDSLKGQGQIQAYLENSAPIPKAPREYKYQGSDPSMTMQVIEAVVHDEHAPFEHVAGAHAAAGGGLGKAADVFLPAEVGDAHFVEQFLLDEVA
jgi:CubicO group peptidase (beta-lactamase class C family)